MAGTVKRPYESPRRRAQAEATRRQILAAAQRLFEAQGYAATTMAAIAREAGVALKTVYVAFETKGGLLRALWHVLLRGDEADVAVQDRSWYRAVLAEPDPGRRLDRTAHNSRVVKERAGALLQAIHAGAAVDDEATGETSGDAATEGTEAGSSTTAFECFAARATGAFSEVLVLAFLAEGAALADTTGSEGFNFLKTYSPELGFGVTSSNYTSLPLSLALQIRENICIWTIMTGKIAGTHHLLLAPAYGKRLPRKRGTRVCDIVAAECATCWQHRCCCARYLSPEATPPRPVPRY